MTRPGRRLLLSRLRRFGTLAVVVLMLSQSANADENYQSLLPRIPSLDPDAALAAFEVHPAFEIELVASEPQVTSPVAIDFDENGRMYVVEMRDYSEQDKEALGQIRLLEDTDGDGRYETDTVFAKGLSWPTAVACANGGVFVGAAPISTS